MRYTHSAGSYREGSVVVFRLAEILQERGWTAYRLGSEVAAEGGEASMRAMYRLARPGAAVRRVDLDTMDLLCRVLDVTPGELLHYSPGKPRRRGR